jgi:ribonuclease HI
MTSTIGDLDALQQISNFIPNTSIFIQIAQPIPPRTRVKTEKSWHILSTPYPMRTNMPTPHFPNYTFALPQKFPPMYSYYTNGSFTPPKQVAPNTWRPEKASYGIYNPIKDLQISERLPRFQNILRAELMAIYTAIQLSITSYTEEPIYIFTDNLNSLYLINTQLRHPSAHNNPPDKTILEKIMEMLQRRTHPTQLHKIKAHSNITGNEIVDALAKRGN